jgi:SNF2 family DNA or RNA helicase
MSFNAFSASNAFFVGAEWSAIENWQAEDRIHRIGQVSDRVNIYYLLYPDTIDDPILQRLDENTFAQNWVLDPLKLLDRLKKS